MSIGFATDGLCVPEDRESGWQLSKRGELVFRVAPYVWGASALLVFAIGVWFLSSSDASAERIFAVGVLMIGAFLALLVVMFIPTRNRLFGKQQLPGFPSGAGGLKLTLAVIAAFGLGFIALALANFGYGGDAALTVFFFALGAMLLLLALYSLMWFVRASRKFAERHERV